MDFWSENNLGRVWNGVTDEVTLAEILQAGMLGIEEF